MDLIYTDKKRRDVGVITSYELDMAFGKDENDFLLKVDLEEHCCEAGAFVYFQDTEYGGIIDKICPNTKTSTVGYEGRTWHGILNSKVIVPDVGEDYFTVSGEANQILHVLISRVGLEDLFSVTTSDSGVTIDYQFARYVFLYDSIRDMLYENSAKLQMSYDGSKVVLSVVPLVNYSEDEEWDKTQMDFSIEKDYHPINHLICLGTGNLRNRHVIHLFSDENGGIQPYAVVKNPYCNEHYILDESKRLLTGSDERISVYDYSNAQDTINYVLMTKRPENWGSTYTNYYYQEEGEFKKLEKSCDNFYSVLTAQPSDWSKNFSKYYVSNSGKYLNVEGIATVSYEKQTRKPSDWNKNYKNYYYYWSDGVTAEYKNVEGITKDKYEHQTMKPSDWKTNYQNYYRNDPAYGFAYEKVTRQADGTYRKERIIEREKRAEGVAGTGAFSKKSDFVYKGRVVIKNNYLKIADAKCPKWKPRRFYTKLSVNRKEEWKKNYYYTKKETTSAPTFENNKYYQLLSSVELIPSWVLNTYYQKFTDSYADLVANGIKKFKELSDKDKISTALSSDIEYDIGDIVGAAENITNISVWKVITKKILKIKGNEETITYEIGE